MREAFVKWLRWIFHGPDLVTKALDAQLGFEQSLLNRIVDLEQERTKTLARLVQAEENYESLKSLIGGLAEGALKLKKEASDLRRIVTARPEIKPKTIQAKSWREVQALVGEEAIDA